MNVPQSLHSLVFVAVSIFLCTANIHADSATWKLNPDDGDWNSANNWSAGGPPNGPSDTAFFGLSNRTDLFLTGNTEVNGITYNANASAFTLTNLASILTISGAGITNNSGIMQNFVVENHLNGASFRFTNSAVAGSLTTFTNKGGAGMGMFGGITEFFDTSTADHATVINNGGAISGAFGGSTNFWGKSSAGNGNFTTKGTTVVNTFGGAIQFQDSSTAGSGVFTNNAGVAQVFGTGGGHTRFLDSSSAGNATLIANGSASGGDGGSIYFGRDSTGGTARVEVFGNGNLDLQFHNSPGLTIGSLEGNGHVLLNGNQLTIGSNNLSTVFSGVIENPPIPRGVDFGGSLVKIGNGTLILSGANTYTGPTTVEAGKLIVNGSINSAVTVNDGGALGGSGLFHGVRINNGGVLAPGNSAGILHAHGNLQLSLGATYLVDLNGAAVGTEYDQTDVMGGVGLSDATLSLSLDFIPVMGSTFTIIYNDSSDLITGMFKDLPDGAVFSEDGQSFTITYHGGDGNDVVVTSVPEPQTWILLIATLIGLFVTRGRFLARNPD